LQRCDWNRGLPVPGRGRLFSLQQQLRAPGRATGTKVVSTVQRGLAGKFVGSNRAIDGLSS
jgi:hypothetical protein